MRTGIGQISCFQTQEPPIQQRTGIFGAFDIVPGQEVAVQRPAHCPQFVVGLFEMVLQQSQRATFHTGASRANEMRITADLVRSNGMFVGKELVATSTSQIFLGRIAASMEAK